MHQWVQLKVKDQEGFRGLWGPYRKSEGQSRAESEVRMSEKIQEFGRQTSWVGEHIFGCSYQRN